MTDQRKSFLVFIGPAALLKLGAAGYTAGFLLNTSATLSPAVDSRAQLVLATLGDLSMRAGVPMLFWGVLLALPLGLVARHLRRRAEAAPSSSALTAEQQAFIAGPSWSAFFWPLGWALVNQQYRRILPAIIPLYNLYYGARLSQHGRAESWRDGGWSDFERFKRRQLSLRWLIPCCYWMAFAASLVSLIVGGYLLLAVATLMGLGDVLKVLLTIVMSFRH